MPNQSDIPTMGMFPEFVETKSFNFRLMFHLDPEGKCRLNWNDQEWKARVEVIRLDLERERQARNGGG